MGEKERVSSCRTCRSWEEEMYWDRFQFTHFTQFFHSGFLQQLAIPEKFYRNLKTKLPEVATLKGPSGSMWRVDLTMNNDIMFFNHGWGEFVKDHSLRENDILIFKYNGDSQFDVLIFDGKSLCERETSYFVKKCGHGEHESSGRAKRKIAQDPEELSFATHQDVFMSTPSGFAGNAPPGFYANNFITPIQDCTASICASNRAQKKNVRLSFSDTRQSARIESPSSEDEMLDIKPDIRNISINQNTGHSLLYPSSSTRVTEEAKHAAVLRAQAALSSEGFIVVMKPTHVSRKFTMAIPSAWLHKHFSTLANQDVILRINDTTWVTKFYYRQARNGGWLSSGWRNFAIENNLQEFDVCVFHLGSPLDNCIALDVNIVRTADVLITPLTSIQVPMKNIERNEEMDDQAGLQFSGSRTDLQLSDFQAGLQSSDFQAGSQFYDSQAGIASSDYQPGSQFY